MATKVPDAPEVPKDIQRALRFLYARMAEDRNTALQAGHGCGYLHEHNGGWVEVELPKEHNTRAGYELRYIRKFNPDRTVAQIDASRKALDQLIVSGIPWNVVRQFLEVWLEPYADHPSYDSGWFEW